MVTRRRFIFIDEMSEINGTTSTILFSSDCTSSRLFTWGMKDFT